MEIVLLGSTQGFSGVKVSEKFQLTNANCNMTKLKNSKIYDLIETGSWDSSNVIDIPNGFQLEIGSESLDNYTVTILWDEIMSKLLKQIKNKKFVKITTRNNKTSKIKYVYNIGKNFNITVNT